MEQDYKSILCTRCFTYNHAPYIVDAMNGFTMQVTTFPVVTVIVDDASTDGEQDIIRQYLVENFQKPFRSAESDDYLLICANHKTNCNCLFVVFLLKYNHYSIKKSKFPYMAEWLDAAKYHAICEGDDYWIEPHKLQLQVDFLDAHPQHSHCIHAFRRDVYGKDGVKSDIIHKYPTDVEIIPDEDVINGTGMFSATASGVYRSSAIRDYPDWAKNAPVGDRPLKFVLFSRGHIAYLDKVMSVYRVGIQGSWTDRTKTNRKYLYYNRKGFLKINKDFDKWTNGRYHKLIIKANRKFIIASLKEDISILVKNFIYRIKR